MPMKHPGGCAAYKIEIGGTQICTLFDNEFEANQLQKLCDFVTGSELVIWDGMFLDEEIPPGEVGVTLQLKRLEVF